MNFISKLLGVLDGNKRPREKTVKGQGDQECQSKGYSCQ